MTSTDNPPKASAKPKSKKSKGVSDSSADSPDTSSDKTSEGTSDSSDDSPDTSSDKTSVGTSDSSNDSPDTSLAGEPSGEQPAATDASGDSDSGILWQSGDWQETNNPSPPYNGIQMVVLPSYSEQSNLVSLTLNFTDFTNETDGVLKTFPMSIKDGSSVTLPVEDDFTIVGTLELRFFASVPGSIVVFFDNISYGLEHQRHNVIGGVLIIPQTGTPTPAAPQTKTSASDSPDADDGSSEGGDPQDPKAPANTPTTSKTPEDS